MGPSLPPRALDASGYIIDQALTGTVPFGHRGSVACGCGWIAAYNLRRWRGDRVSPGQVARTVHRISPFSGRWGVNLLSLLLYLLFCGMWPVLLPVTARSRKRGRAGILMYHVKGGGHYVACLREGEGYRFLNGSYGLQDDLQGLGDFFSRHSRWPVGLMLAVFPRRRRGD